VALKDLDFDHEVKRIKLDSDIRMALIKQIEIDVTLF
jgi:hypothetical protein